MCYLLPISRGLVILVYFAQMHYITVALAQLEFFLLLLGLKTLKVATGKCDSHILKISPGAYIFQRSFLRGLFLEGLIFRGAHLWREICVSKSIGQAFYLEVN